MYTPDLLYWKQRQRKRSVNDWISLFATFVKLLEFCALWFLGARLLACVTCITWAYFLISAVVLQLLSVSSELEGSNRLTTCLDLLEGNLPSFQVPGGERKVLLGVPLNVRRHMAWRIAWLLGAIVSTATMVPLYQIIGSYKTRIFYVWVAFQAIWLLARSIYFHFADEMIHFHSTIAPISEDEAQNPEIKLRLLALIGAVSQQMIPAHPRGSYCYSLDCNDPCNIMSFFRHAEWRVSTDVLDYTSRKVGDEVEIDVEAVVGDTMLSSVSWITDLQLSSKDLYDTSLVVIKLNGQTFIIPSARALSTPPKPRGGENAEEGPRPGFYPKGGTNDGTSVAWIFWVPAGVDRWLFLSPGLDFVGRLTGVVLDDAEVSRRLAIGSFYISLRDTQEIKEIIFSSAMVGEALCSVIEIGRAHV